MQDSQTLLPNVVKKFACQRDCDSLCIGEIKTLDDSCEEASCTKQFYSEF